MCHLYAPGYTSHVLSHLVLLASSLWMSMYCPNDPKPIRFLPCLIQVRSTTFQTSRMLTLNKNMINYQRIFFFNSIYTQAVQLWLCNNTCVPTTVEKIHFNSGWNLFHCKNHSAITVDTQPLLKLISSLALLDAWWFCFWSVRP